MLTKPKEWQHGGTVMYCDPERLQALQRIYDTLCVVLQLKKTSVPFKGKDLDRNDIARHVMTCAEADMSDGDIFLAVLEILNAQDSLKQAVPGAQASLSHGSRLPEAGKPSN
jgi:hypothetical protein